MATVSNNQVAHPMQQQQLDVLATMHKETRSDQFRRARHTELKLGCHSSIKTHIRAVDSMDQSKIQHKKLAFYPFRFAIGIGSSPIAR